MTISAFRDLGLSEPIVHALRGENYTRPTPIQLATIPRLLQGKDLIAVAQTGTGKTAAYGLPLLERLAAQNIAPRPKTAQALILAPTRELAAQIHDSLNIYGRHLNLRHTVITGGVKMQPQIRALGQGVHVLIATAGRLLEHAGLGNVRLDQATTLILDEADRMLDMGFIHDVRKIVNMLPKARQSALFSATMAPEVVKLAAHILHNPEHVAIAPQGTTADRVAQNVIFVDRGNKASLLLRLLEDPQLSRAIVFTRTKRGANRVAETVAKAGIEAEALHGNKSQAARQRALARFASGQARVMVATDIAARGIDIDDVTHVINYELPDEPENYVHRIGRTARAGTEGIAVAFCDAGERQTLRAIEKLTGHPLAVMDISGMDLRAPQGNRVPAPAAPQQRPAHGARSDGAASRPARAHRDEPQDRPARRRRRKPYQAGGTSAGHHSDGNRGGTRRDSAARV